MAEANAAVVQRAVDRIWNGGDLALADRLFGPTYLNHGGIISDLVYGPEAIKISVALLRVAFPFMHVTIVDLASAGDTVELHWMAENNPNDVSNIGTDSNDSGRLRGLTRSTLTDGKIVESWTDWDHMSAQNAFQTKSREAQP